MNYLTIEGHLYSSNAAQNISKEKEIVMVAECMTFIQNMASKFDIDLKICETALTIFHLYQKKFSFIE